MPDRKKTLRQKFLGDRQALPVDVWQGKNLMICERLARWQPFLEARVILAFFSIRQEPDLSNLWQRFPAKIWGFPRCVGNDLAWHQVDPLRIEQSTTKRTFGILEPLPNLPQIVLSQVDLIFVPAIACDYQGYRLGYGGGYYDRFLPQQVGNKVGIVFESARVEQLPIEPWDIPMQAVCTERDLVSIGDSGREGRQRVHMWTH